MGIALKVPSGAALRSFFDGGLLEEEKEEEEASRVVVDDVDRRGSLSFCSLTNRSCWTSSSVQ
jgi:hypothetical protein